MSGLHLLMILAELMTSHAPLPKVHSHAIWHKNNFEILLNIPLEHALTKHGLVYSNAPWSLPWCSSTNLQFPHRVPFTNEEKMPWCPCPFKRLNLRFKDAMSDFWPQTLKNRFLGVNGISKSITRSNKKKNLTFTFNDQEP